MSICDGNCQNDLKSVELINEELRKKVKETRDRYINLLAENLKKDYTLTEMKKKIQFEDGSSKIFSTFEPILGQHGVEQIRLISSDKSKDSSFILNIIRLLFPLQSLNKLSVSGRKDTEKLSIEKVEIIRLLFEERLQKDVDFDKRFAKLNVHIKNGILNSRQPGTKVEKIIDTEQGSCITTTDNKNDDTEKDTCITTTDNTNDPQI